MTATGRGPVSATLVLSLAVFAISWAAILVRLCEAPSLGIAFWRLFLATLVVLPWGARRGGPVSARTQLIAAAAGLLLALHFATWITSLSMTTVASSVVIVTSQPVFTAALGPLVLDERPGPRGLAAVALALFGTAVLAGGDLRLGGRALLGDLLALAGAIAASGYFMIGRGLRARIEFPRYLLLVNGTSALALGAMALGGGAPLGGYPLPTWGWLVLLAVGPHIVGHGLLNWSVRRLRAFTVNMAVLGEPVLATAYAALLFREIPGAAFLVGAALIAAGIVLAAREEARSGRYNPPGSEAGA